MNTPVNRMNPHVYPGQRVVTAAGTVQVVAFVSHDGRTFVYGPRGMPTPARVAFDALGGEPELTPGVRVATSAGPPSPGPRSGHSRTRLSLAA